MSNLQKKVNLIDENRNVTTKKGWESNMLMMGFEYQIFSSSELLSNLTIIILVIVLILNKA